MTRRNAVAATTLLTLASAALIVFFVGCGGHGPTLASPPGVVAGADIIEVEDYIVAPREVVQYDRDTIVRASGEALIEGAVIGADGAGPGRTGVSITIEAEGDVTIGGAVRAGAGGQASDALHSVTQPDDQTTGGDGGSLTITSTGGDVTLAEGAEVAAGDGAGGGNSLTGGPGGKGGDVSISAVEGTVSLPQTDDLIHIGNGGDGGEGSISPEDMQVAGIPNEATGHGGDSGGFAVTSSSLTGPTIEGTPPDAIVWLEPASVTGGAGGDGGAFVSGEEAEPAGRDIATRSGLSLPPNVTSTHLKQDDRPWLIGACGGDGVFVAGAGGDALSGDAGQWGRDDPYEPNQWGGATGGRGGDLNMTSWTATDGQILFVLFGREIIAGQGGYAVAAGDRGRWGAPCEDGDAGGHARARGGQGGTVVEDLFRDYHLAILTVEGGPGGDAIASGGGGGNGGDCCDPPGPGPGGAGGRGSGDAKAWGGRGGDQQRAQGGNGGGVLAQVGTSGDGGDGSPPGDPDEPDSTAVLSSVGGEGGSGSPPGRVGRASSIPPDFDASPGEVCPGAPPPPSASGYSATVATYDYAYPEQIRTIDELFKDLFPQQAKDDRLGGGAFPIFPLPGQSMAISADKSRLWVRTTHGYFVLYIDPFTGGERGSDAVITASGSGTDTFLTSGLWYDRGRDMLYVTQGVGGAIHVWHNASTMTANRPADRTIRVQGFPGATAGDSATDRLFFRTNDGVHALDNVSTLAGTVVPDRSVEIDTGSGQWAGCGGLAYHGAADRLFVGRCDLGNDSVVIIENASQADGQVARKLLFGANTGIDDAPMSLFAFPDMDHLIVGVRDGDILVFENASTIEGNVAPADRDAAQVFGMGIIRN